MRWIYAFAAVFVLIALVWQAQPQRVWIAFTAVIFWLVAANSMRCPRCRRHILDNGKGYSAPWLRTPERCIGCGREKKGLWPFQWALRPER
jgi:hypothetical protein